MVQTSCFRPVSFLVFPMKSAFRSLFLGLALSGLAASATQASPAKDRQFFQKIEGAWSGPGEIVAGKYKGTKFNCNLQGMSGQARSGMTLDGVCRVGVFTEKIRATVEARGNAYAGTFMDGAKGNGLDVVGGNVVGGERVVLTLARAQLRGAMIARVKADDSMVVTVSVRVDGKMVPVMGMNLKRVDGLAVGSTKP